jgi:hypothetical protein
MKKSMFFATLLILSGSAYSQLIPKAGLTMATTSSDFEDLGPDFSIKETLKPGFMLGVGYAFTFGNISVQPEILFIQKGGTIKSDVTLDPQGPWTYKVTQDITTQYLEVPVMARYNFGPDELRFYVGAGPALALGLGGRVKGSYQENYFGDITNESIDAKVKFDKEPEGYEGNDLFIEKKTEVSAQLSGGVVIGNKFMVDLRYGLGLTDWGNDEKTKNRVLQLSVGFLISR